MRLQQLICPLVMIVTIFTGILNANAQRKEIPIHQIDARFHLSAEKSWSSLGGQEEYWFSVQNNTIDEYKIVINIILELACVESKPFSLGFNRVVYLKSNGRFEPKDDYFHIYSAGVDNGKNCRLVDGNSFTLFKGMRYSISSIVNLTAQKALEEQKIKEAEAQKLQKSEEERKIKEKLATQSRIEAEKKNDEREKTQQEKQTTQSNNTNNSNKSGVGSLVPNLKANNQDGSSLLSEKVKVNGEYVQVFKQDGEYYMVHADGSQHTTAKEAYDDVNGVIARKTITQTNSNNNNLATNETQSNSFNGTPVSNSADPSKFELKLSDIGITENYTNSSGNTNPMISNNHYTPTYSDDKNQQAVGTIVNTVAPLLAQWGNQIQARREQREQEESNRLMEQTQREEAAAELKAQKIRLVAARKDLIAKLPDGKTPLSSEAKDAKEVYFFTFSYQVATLVDDAPVIYISNVFSVAKYGDGSWPFKASLMENIAKTNKGLDLVLSGYYLNKNEAEQQQQTLMSGAYAYGFAVNNINYVSRKSSTTTNGNIDYWGNLVKSNEQVPNTDSLNKQNPIKPKAKVDFWGNPIKD